MTKNGREIYGPNTGPFQKAISFFDIDSGKDFVCLKRGYLGTYKLLLDMNLSPDWIPLLESVGTRRYIGRDLGAADAPGHEIMAWARNNGCLVLTQDLDFGALLHATGAVAPSVMQFRDHDVRPDSMG